MWNDTVVRFWKKDEVVDPLVKLLRNGAHELIGRAVDVELRVFLEQRAGDVRRMARLRWCGNGYQPERALLTGMGPVRVQVAQGTRPARARGGVSLHAGAAVPAAQDSDLHVTRAPK